MKSIIALGVGLVVALAPGTAFAAPEANSTGSGNAYGNCQHSSATGNHDQLPDGPLAGKHGKGGWVTVAKVAVPKDVACSLTPVPPPSEVVVVTPQPGDNDEANAPAA